MVEFEETLGQAAFVSHQWVGRNHPDPEFKQMRVLQDALRHVMSDLKNIPLDMNSEALVPGCKCLDTAKLRSKPLFVWYDYFSCPQLDLQVTASWRTGTGRHVSDWVRVGPFRCYNDREEVLRVAPRRARTCPPLPLWSSRIVRSGFVINMVI